MKAEEWEKLGTDDQVALLYSKIVTHQHLLDGLANAVQVLMQDSCPISEEEWKDENGEFRNKVSEPVALTVIRKIIDDRLNGGDEITRPGCSGCGAGCCSPE